MGDVTEDGPAVLVNEPSEPFRIFKVVACTSERILENKLNELERGGYTIYGVFHKVSGGFTIVATIRTGSYVPVDVPQGEPNEEESGFQGDPPETI